MKTAAANIVGRWRSLLAERPTPALFDAARAEVARCAEVADALLLIALADDSRTASWALWVLTHCEDVAHDALQAQASALMDAALAATHATRRRLLLHLLASLTFEADALRGDFIDFCYRQADDAQAPYAVRALSLRLAYLQSVHHAELFDELRRTLHFLQQQPLSPGLRSTVRQLLRRLKH